MNKVSSFWTWIEFAFHPLVPMLLFIFFCVTTIHHQLPVTQHLPIENTLTLAILLNTIIWCFLNRPEIKPSLLLILVLAFSIAPLISSITQNDYLNIVKDTEYRTFLRMLIISPTLVFFICAPKSRDIILTVLLISFLGLALVFLYRLYFLLEVREFDLRPSLLIRHGDANFLGTFFAMISPIPIYLGFHKSGFIRYALCLLSLFFILCCFITESRMAILSILIGIFYLLHTLMNGKRRIFAYLTFTTVLSGLMLLAGDRIIQRFVNLNDKSNQERTLSLLNGAIAFSNAPLFGQGMHKTADSFFLNTEYPPFITEANSLDVHNSFLKAFSDLGLFGGTLYLALFFLPLYHIRKQKSPLSSILTSSWIILFVCCLSIGVTYKDLIFLHLFILFGLGFYQSQPEYNNRCNI